MLTPMNELVIDRPPRRIVDLNADEIKFSGRRIGRQNGASDWKAKREHRESLLEERSAKG